MLAGLAALVPLLAVYAVRSPDVSGVEVRYDWAVNYLLTREGLDHLLGTWLSYGWLSHVWLPRELTDLFNGIIAVKAHNDAGHRSYLLGQVSHDGWWYFYFVTLAVKTPLPLLVAGPLGLVWLARNGWREPQRLGACAGGAGSRDPRVRQRLQPHQHRHPPRAHPLSLPCPWAPPT